jgi:2-polyprenyl-6-methoxyphenol hydroxylase-like FAD-dependent oxidoreductase
MRNTHRALVAGAGIAGVATATALHQLSWEVDLAERRPGATATVPTGLFIPANGMRAFAALGTAELLLSRGQAVARMCLRAAGCATEGVAELADVWPGTGPCVAISRADALDALIERCPVPVRAGVCVQHLSQRGTHVEALFSDGSRHEYDLLVGADGAYSTIRRLVWPQVTPAYGGESYWRGVVPCPAGLADWSACFCAAGTFLAMPIGGGLAYWAAGCCTGSAFTDPGPGRAERVRERFGDITGIHAQVLSHIRDDASVQFSPADQVWVETPVRGRVVLAGDAWHATTPNMAQGGSMAAEDALVLAAELAAGPGIDEALARYAARRLPRTRHVQDTTAMRTSLAALPLPDRASFVIPNWAELSKGAFAPLVPDP